jgi:hypothetical protein
MCKETVLNTMSFHTMVKVLLTETGRYGIPERLSKTVEDGRHDRRKCSLGLLRQVGLAELINNVSDKLWIVENTYNLRTADGEILSRYRSSRRDQESDVITLVAASFWE